MRSRYWCKPIGTILVEKKLATRDELAEALLIQQSRPQEKIGEILVALGCVSVKDVMRAFADQLGTAYAKRWAAWR
jgi:hypothetical protein